MVSILQLPDVVDNFDGQIEALDQAILVAATGFNFSYNSPAPTFQELYHLPDLIYKLIQHYTMRGFLCTYNGDIGQLKIDWDHPNMSWLEHREITRSTPDMIPKLGFWFRAGFLYLCMTNGNDLRSETDSTLKSKLDKAIKSAAVLGNTELYFGIPGSQGVPAPTLMKLYHKTFDTLLDNGFLISYDTNQNSFVLRWGNTLNINLFSGENLSLVI